MHPDLIARYADERLPRYTSYPTAPHFSAAVGPDTYGAWLGSIRKDAVGSVYVHVPFCRRMCWYCGCNTAVTPRSEPVTTYLAALAHEIELVTSRIGHRLAVAHLHFGGGTPTIVKPHEFLALMSQLRRVFEIRADAEVAMEIDPRTLSAEMAVALGEAGVTRASIGVQSLDETVQVAINRRQTFAQTTQAIDRLRKAGVKGINLDLIYGLPHQTVASCLETVDRCLALRPARFSVFGYAHVPAFKKHQRRIDEATLPGGAERAAEAEAIAARLEQAGYRRIGLDHFALPDDAMAAAGSTGTLHRNFQGYTTDRADTLIGLGASSIGRLLPYGYVQNAPVVRDYLAAVAEERLATVKGFALSPGDRLRAELIERLMCDFEVDIAGVCRRHGETSDAVADAQPGLARLAAEGVIRRHGDRIELEPDARNLVRAVAATFDTYRAASARTHSPAL